jgi:hypothetical protein
MASTIASLSNLGCATALRSTSDVVDQLQA